MIVEREIKHAACSLAGQYPVLTITGPRQSGKTTFVKSVFTGYQYYSLEDPDVRELALSDPRGFLKQIKGGVILDEIQRSPELLSYIQGVVDISRKPGQFILTGSHQLELQSSISQSLAGRTGLLKLLPFSIKELKKIHKEQSAESYILKGMYPGLYERKIDHTVFYKNYFETYIERDLRQLIMVRDLRLFRKFLRLAAGRIGQLFSASNMANDVGVSVPTINSWLSILEASFVVFLLEPYYVSTGKRLIKSPKLYFYDTGLASYLLGIETSEQMERDPLKGNLFENFVIMEIVKLRYNAGLDHNLSFYRDSNGNEVDVLYTEKGRLVPVEIKSAGTFTGDFLKGLNYIHKIFPDKADGGYLVYSGKMEQEVNSFRLINFVNTSEIVKLT